MESECSYCSVPEFNTYIDHHNPFIIFNQNIRSFNQNYESLSVFLSDFDKRFEIIVLTETWFREGACYNIDGYSGYHTYRTERSGGGECLSLQFMGTNLGFDSRLVGTFSSPHNCGDLSP